MATALRPIRGGVGAGGGPAIVAFRIALCRPFRALIWWAVPRPRAMPWADLFSPFRATIPILRVWNRGMTLSPAMKSLGYDRSVPPGRPRGVRGVCAARFLRPFRGGVARSRRTTGFVRLRRTPPVATALRPIRGESARGGTPIRSWTLRSLITVLLGRRSSFVPSGLGFFFSLFPVGLRRTAIGFRPCGALDRAMTPSPVMKPLGYDRSVPPGRRFRRVCPAPGETRLQSTRLTRLADSSSRREPRTCG